MSGDKTKAASQTDWKMAQNKMSEMGMASYKVRVSCWDHPLLAAVFGLSSAGGLVSLLRVSGHILTFALQMHLYEQENFQGRAIEITGECMNVCDVGMDKVRSLRVECGP